MSHLHKRVGCESDSIRLLRPCSRVSLDAPGVRFDAAASLIPLINVSRKGKIK